MKSGFREFLREAAKSKLENARDLNLKEQATKLLRAEAREKKAKRKAIKTAKRKSR